jgi:hypothetical protein
MPTHDVSGHPLLSAAVADLDEPDFLVHNEIAETVLCLADETFTPAAKAERALHAVALQMNAQVATGDSMIVAQAIKREKRGDREVEYAQAGPEGKSSVAIHPLARRIAEKLLTHTVLTSLRGPQT